MAANVQVMNDKDLELQVKEAEFALAEKQQGYGFADENNRHAHLLDGKELHGTTKVVNKVLPPELAWYGSGKAVECLGVPDAKVLTKIKKGEATKGEITTLKKRLGEAHEAIKTLDLDGYYELVDQAYRKHDDHKNKKAVEGSEMHDALERYVRHCIDGNGGVPLLLKAKDKRIERWIRWACKEVARFRFAEVHCYSRKLWMGGKFDIIFELKNGMTILGDYKSAPQSYHKNWIQMAFYDIEQSENGIFTKDGVKLSDPLKIDGYALFPFGGKITPDYRYTTTDYKEGAMGVYKNFELMTK